ncbi:hypothetical protein [Allosphingosinicella sp.]|jgi:hypothetical protein|uniref:hypothetical protein n=1 Tax=Allosphingosinicella sp. TaxID=2823234 RepID=UPI002F149CB2
MIFFLAAAVSLAQSSPSPPPSPADAATDAWAVCVRVEADRRAGGPETAEAAAAAAFGACRSEEAALAAAFGARHGARRGVRMVRSIREGLTPGIVQRIARQRDPVAREAALAQSRDWSLCLAERVNRRIFGAESAEAEADWAFGECRAHERALGDAVAALSTRGAADSFIEGDRVRRRAELVAAIEESRRMRREREEGVAAEPRD